MKTWLTPFSFSLYPKKLKSAISRPTYAGRFFEKETEERGMRLATGSAGSKEDGNLISLFWIVDPDDGNIVDAKYLAFGETPLIGAAEVISRWIIGRNYDQARRLTSTLVEKEIEGPFPRETLSLLNLVLEAVETTANTCTDIPLAMSYSAPPVSFSGEILEGGVPNWFNLAQNEQIAIIEEVLTKDIRPYIELDAGGVEVLNLINGKELIIAYQGSCTSCYSSTGATLSYIQQVLRAKVHPELFVTPDL